jgi:two-component system chemotaxis sensor kinase CheA
MIDFDDLKKTFFQECADYITAFEDQFDALQKNCHNKDSLNAVFRSVHSIKGGAAAFGFEDIVNFSHAIENVLDRVRSDEMTLTQDSLDICMRAVDVLSDLIEATRRNEPYINSAKAELMLKLEELEKGQGASSSQAANDMKRAHQQGQTAQAEAEPEPEPLHHYHIVFKPQRGLYYRANEPQLLFRELKTLGQLDVLCHQDYSQSLENFDPFTPVFSWTLDLYSHCAIDAVFDVFEFADDDCELEITCVHAQAPCDEKDQDLERPSVSLDDLLSDLNMDVEQDHAPFAIPQDQIMALKAATPAPEHDDVLLKDTPYQDKVDSIRIDLKKIDKVINMVGEIVITQSILKAQLDDYLHQNYPDLMQGVDILAQHTRQLQDHVMSIRAQPMKTVFGRLPRLLRELCAQTGKKVVLEIEGEATEIDKTVVEQLVDPLMHMVRNAVDHGIESPQERKAKGKPESGTLWLSAEQKGDKIHICVRDDGQGLHPDKLLKRAIDKGLVEPDARLTYEEILDLIFCPGFSTASDISNISGRGVGMDVVRQNIHKLGGRISLESKPDQGMCVSMILPLTLAVMDVMLIELSGVHYVLPLNVIVESFQSSKVKKEMMAGGETVMKMRNEYVCILNLAELLGLTPQPESERDYIIVCHIDGQDRIGLKVNAILGQQQVVIKSLEEHFEKIQGVSGATILGDGNVALILDVDGLMRLNKDKVQSDMAA